MLNLARILFPVVVNYAKLGPDVATQAEDEELGANEHYCSAQIEEL